MVPFPKALVLLGSLADGVDDGAIALPLVPRLSPLALQLLGAVDLIVYIRLLGASGQGIAISGLASDALVELLGGAAKEFSGFGLDRQLVNLRPAAAILELRLEVFDDISAINAMLLRQGLGLAQ